MMIKIWMLYHDFLVNFTCIPSVPCIRASGSNNLLMKTSSLHYVTSENKIVMYCNLIYHDLHAYDTMKIPK